ncbi:tetratricopeptide repeat protein [Candidatus Hydrogenedentota bacterium]
MANIQDRKEVIILSIVAVAGLIAAVCLQVKVDKLNEASVVFRWLEAQQFMSSVDEDVSSTPEAILYDNFQEKAGELGMDDLGGATRKELWSLAKNANCRGMVLEFNELRKENMIRAIAVSNIDLGAQDVGEHLASLMLGFRNLAANLVWLRADQYWHNGLVVMMLPSVTLAVTLDPHFIDAYAVGGWHLSYNLPVKIPSEKADLWERSNNLLKDGVRNNTATHRLYWELGFSNYFVKMRRYRDATEYLAPATKKLDTKSQVFRGLAQAYERAKDYEKAIETRKAILKDWFPEEHESKRWIDLLQAKIYERDGKYDEARSLYKKMLKESPDDFDPYMAKIYLIDGKELELNGKLDKALEIYKNLARQVYKYPARDIMDAQERMDRILDKLL